MDKTKKNTIDFVESIFEIRWGSQKITPTNLPSLDYKVFVGKIVEEIQQGYPYFEPLDSAKVPEDMVQGVTQYRFRIDKDKWPLVQLGPGLFTVNDTEDSWEKFKRIILQEISTFTKYAPASALNNNPRLALNYIYGIDLSDNSLDILEYLQSKVNFKLHIDHSFYDFAKIKRSKAIELKLSFECEDSNSTLDFLIGSGKKKESDAIIININFSTNLSELTTSSDYYAKWLQEGKNTIDAWYKKLFL